MSTRNHLTSEQKEILVGLWEEGMTSVKRKDLVNKAVEHTGLDEQTIRNWVGNQKKSQGMAVKRGERETKGNLPSKIRKKSAYSVFKSRFLASETVKKLKEDGVSYADIQKQGNMAYQQMSQEERQEYETLAETANENLLTSPSGSLSKEKMIRRIIANIDTNMKQLDELGCPSVWLGYGGRVPERLYSPQMVELAEDSVFTNYVVSKMMNKIARSQMMEIPKSRPKEQSSSSSNKKRRVKEGRTNTKPSNPDKTPADNDAEVCLEIGETVNIVSATGVSFGHGVVTCQKTVHGRELTYGWIPLMVKEIQSNVKPWTEFPTHSNLVETDSFVAWPKAFLKPVKKT